MNTLRNRVQLIGNLGKDPEIKAFDNGKKVARFTMATSDTYKKEGGEKVTETHKNRQSADPKTAEIP